MIAQFLVNGIITGSLYALIGVSFGLIYYTVRIFHIAHGAVYTVSAYIFYTFYRQIGMPILPSFLIGLIVGTLLGILFEILIYQPLYKKEAHPGVALISSIGAYIFVVNLIALIYGSETKIPYPYIQKTYSLGNIIVTQIQLIELIVSAIIILIFALILKYTKLGKLIRALSDNPSLLESLGTDVLRLRVVIFAIGSFFVGIASCLNAIDVGIDPNVGMPALLTGAVSAIIGGYGRFIAPALGGLLLGLLENLVVWKFSARWKPAVVFVILILFLLFRPQGILGIKGRVEEKEGV